jgi:hypothetical protein
MKRVERALAHVRIAPHGQQRPGLGPRSRKGNLESIGHPDAVTPGKLFDFGNQSGQVGGAQVPSGLVPGQPSVLRIRRLGVRAPPGACLRLRHLRREMLIAC